MPPSVVVLIRTTHPAVDTVYQVGDGAVTLWDSQSGSVSPIETSMNRLSFLQWSLESELVIGTQTGNLLIYNKERVQLTSIIGKHNGSIICGDWDGENQLALGSTDSMLSISDKDGDTTREFNLEEVPCGITFNDSSITDKSRPVVIVSSHHAWHYTEQTSKPTRLPTTKAYGEILYHHWLSHDSILLAHRNGYLVSLKTDGTEEVWSKEVCAESMDAAVYSPSERKVAVAGMSIQAFHLRENNSSSLLDSLYFFFFSY